MSKVFSLLAIGALSLGLVACSSGEQENPGNNTASCSAYTLEQLATDLSVCGELGKVSSVKFTAPLSTEVTKFDTLVKGSGETLVEGDNMMVAYNIYNATTGKAIVNEEIAKQIPGEMVSLDFAVIFPGLAKALDGQTIGSRVAVLIPPVDAYGEQGMPSLEVAPTDNVLWVLDLISLVGDAANGTPQDVSDIFPKVSLAESGQPTITIPDTAAPADLQLGVLKQGSGLVVESGATVWIQYQGVNWRTGEVFDQSWGGKIATFSLDRVVEGFSKAIEGQKVGSQVIVIVPPALGYGPMGGQPSAGIEADDTLVFVIDILAARN